MPPPPLPYEDPGEQVELNPEEEYETLVRRRPVRAVGAHRVSSSGTLQWCVVCRAACHTGGREQLPGECSREQVRATFAGDFARVQLTHETVLLQKAVFCLRCGACSTR